MTTGTVIGGGVRSIALSLGKLLAALILLASGFFAVVLGTAWSEIEVVNRQTSRALQLDARGLHELEPYLFAMLLIATIAFYACGHFLLILCHAMTLGRTLWVPSTHPGRWFILTTLSALITLLTIGTTIGTFTPLLFNSLPPPSTLLPGLCILGILVSSFLVIQRQLKRLRGTPLPGGERPLP